MQPRVLIADDHALVADGIRRILEAEFEIAGICADGRALLRMAAETNPDIIVIDIAMPLLNGLDAARQLRKDGVRSRIVILTGNPDPGLARQAWEAGASGYVLKHSAASELVTAIREALAGRLFLSSGVDTVAAGSENESAQVRLSAREREVLQLLAEGKSIKEVAAVLGVSPRTVEFHRQNLSEKTGLRSTAELARYAVRQGLVS